MSLPFPRTSRLVWSGQHWAWLPCLHGRNYEHDLYFDVSQSGASSIAQAFFLFDGEDVGLDTLAEEIDGITTFPGQAEGVSLAILEWNEL